MIHGPLHNVSEPARRSAYGGARGTQSWGIPTHARACLSLAVNTQQTRDNGDMRTDDSLPGCLRLLIVYGDGLATVDQTYSAAKTSADLRGFNLVESERCH